MFIASWVVHSADHIRRGTEFTSDGVIWAGTFVAILTAVALTLVYTDHAAAPLVVAAVFAATAIGVAASHYAP